MFLPVRGNKTLSKMSAKFVFVATFLCCSLYQLASATEYVAVRDAALKKLADQRKLVDEYAFKLSFERENEILNSQTYTRIDHAGSLKQRANFEMEQLLASYRLIAELMGVNKYVMQCMEETTRKAQTDNQQFNYANCYQPVHQSHVDAGNEETNKMFEWSEKKTALYREYTGLYDATTLKLKKSENPEEMKSSLDGVMEKGEQLIAAAKQAIAEIRKIEIDQLQFADDRLAQVREYTRKSVDSLSGALQNCFLTKSPFFNLRKVFIKEDLL